MDSPDITESTLLIVSDQSSDCQRLNALLIPEGYQLYFATNHTQALEDGPSLNPDVILIDASFSGSTGLEVCQHLRKDPLSAKIPILMFAPQPIDGMYRTYLEAGATDLVTTPFLPPELLARVKNLVLLSQLQKTSQQPTGKPSQTDSGPLPDPNLRLLQSVISTIATQLDPYEILYSTCEVLSQVFRVPYVTAWMANEEHTQFEQVAKHPLYPQTRADPQATRPSYSVVRSSLLGEMISVDDTPWLKKLVAERQMTTFSLSQEEGPRFPIRFGKSKAGDRQKTILPLITKGNVTGLIELVGEPGQAFNEPELELAGGIATTIGDSLEAVKLFRRLQDYAEFLDKSLAKRTQELEGERDRTQSILEALGEAVVVTDLDGIIQYVNQAAVELTGYARKNLLGRRMRLWRSHRQTAELYTQMLSRVQEGRTWRGEVINERRDGSLYDAALTVAPLYGGDKREVPIGYVSVQRDITPVKEAERIKDQFISNVSHELRTPLSIITLLTGNLDTLYERLDDEKRRKLIRDIRGHIQVLNDLITNVLEISRLEGVRVAKDRQPFNLVDIVCEEAEKQMPLAKNKYQTMIVNGGEPLVITGNSGQVRQVFRNLINNAIKYTPEGGYILCECKAFVDPVDDVEDWPGCRDLVEGQWGGARVKDTGIGISTDDQGHLFERFYRVESQGNIPGAGLGLSIAKDLVKLHGGQIAVTSTPFEGSVFAVYFPLTNGGSTLAPDKNDDHD